MTDDRQNAPPQVPDSGTKNPQPLPWRAIIVASAAVVVLRLVYAWNTDQVPYIRHLIGDAAGYYNWALAIAQGEWVGREAFYQAPLYPYVLAMCFKVFGSSIETIRTTQAIWSGLGAMCLGYGTGRLMGWRSGMVAIGLLGLYGPAMFFDGIVQKASLGSVLVCGLIAAIAWVRSTRSWYSVVLLGVVAALTILVRENAMIWIPILATWIYIETGQRNMGARATRVAMLLLGMGLVLGPVATRNRVVGGQWSLSTFQAGPNFYIGNHREASGRYEPLVRGHETPMFERKDATRLAEEDLRRKLSPSEVSAYWMSRSFEEIASHPADWLQLMGRKFLLVWNSYEISDAESVVVYSGQSLLLRSSMMFAHFGLLCPLAAIGIVVTWRQWRRLWILYALIASMALAVALFYVMARYRFPIAILLIPFGARALVEVGGWVKRRSFHKAIVPAGVGVVVALLANLPIVDEGRLDAMAWMNVGVAMAQEGELGQATGYFRRAVIGNPDSAEANNNLAQAVALQGEYVAAIPYYQKALAIDPTLIGVDFNLAVALERTKRVADALRHYQRAAQLDPSDGEARRAVARLSSNGPT